MFNMQTTSSRIAQIFSFKGKKNRSSARGRVPGSRGCCNLPRRKFLILGLADCAMVLNRPSSSFFILTAIFPLKSFE